MKIKIKKIIASILTFMMIFTQVPVNVFAETKGESIPLDITLVLDVSGSMDDPLSGGTKRMSVLKEVRIILRNILHGKMQVQKFVYNIIALK